MLFLRRSLYKDISCYFQKIRKKSSIGFFMQKSNVIHKNVIVKFDFLERKSFHCIILKEKKNTKIFKNTVVYYWVLQTLTNCTIHMNYELLSYPIAINFLFHKTHFRKLHWGYIKKY